MYDDFVRVDPKKYIGKVVNHTFINRRDDSVIHQSGDIFTEETIENLRRANLVQKNYYGTEEYMDIPAAVSGQKCYEFTVEVAISYNTYRIWADSEEEAREELEDDPGDPWDSDGDRCFNIIDTEEITEKFLEDIENQKRWEIERKERELERLKQHWRKK